MHKCQGGQCRPGGSIWVQGGLGEKEQIQIPGNKGKSWGLYLPVAQNPFLCHFQEFPLNPKALSLGELYGEYDLNTNEWTDGVLSSVMRMACAGTQRIVGWGEQTPESPKGVGILEIESSI